MERGLSRYMFWINPDTNFKKERAGGKFTCFLFFKDFFARLSMTIERIKETIVVEGKNDAAAVRRAVDADIIITSGFGLTGKTLALIKTAQERHGVIVLTDPDFMGEKIRSIIAQKIKGIRHAFIPLEEARDEADIGVENAKPDSIRKALAMARCEMEEAVIEFTSGDMAAYGLNGGGDAVRMRRKVGAILGIGYTNSKQMVNRLNRYGISRTELEGAVLAARWDSAKS